jgi:hypothetical protein
MPKRKPLSAEGVLALYQALSPQEKSRFEILWRELPPPETERPLKQWYTLEEAAFSLEKRPS